jgi:large subunit ribosomal protein L17
MHHGKSGRKLGRTQNARRSLARAQATALLRSGRIQTTLAKAKELRGFVEELITTAKGGDLHARRQVLQDLQDVTVVRKLFDELAPKYRDRPGGYVRVLKVGFRRGDASEVALVELV